MRYLTGDDTGRYGALPGQTNALRETRPSPPLHPMADLFAEIAADSTPVYGNYRSYEAAKSDFGAGNYGWGAVNALGAVPGLAMVGAVGRGARRAGNAMAFRPAFKMRDGAIISTGPGTTHGHVVRKLKEQGLEFDDMEDSGFVDAAGQYVTREDALKAAALHSPDMSIRDRNYGLVSEDLRLEAAKQRARRRE